jgi:hypothetical protein
MLVLFAGEESEFRAATEAGADSCSFPLFFYPFWGCEFLFREADRALPIPDSTVYWSAVIIPARNFLLCDSFRVPCPVFVSGPPSLLHECLVAGCTDYLRVPWTTEEFLARWEMHNRYLSLDDSVPVRLDAGFLTGPLGEIPIKQSMNILLRLFMANRGLPIPRRAIGLALGRKRVDGRAADMQVSRLRKALRVVGLERYADALHAVPGGYSLHV